jgi:tRNA(Ile)-lysidine synthase
VVHVNHGLRGADADSDEAFCTALADRLELPIVVERADVRARAAQERTSIESAGRLVRHDVFDRAARRLDAAAVAVGHTQQDQAETVLLHLLRGAGGRGLGAFAPRRGLVVRPLLDAGREELRDWLRHRGIAFVDDETNADLGNPRNRLRHAIIPGLVTHFGPHVRESLARAADTLRDEDRFLESLTDREAANVIDRPAGAVEIALADLAPLDRALQRRVLLRALRLAGVRDAGTAEVERVGELVAGGCPSTDLPGGVAANRIGDRVVLSKRAPDPDAARPGDCRTLPIPGEIAIDEAFLLRAEYPVRLSPGAALSSPDRLAVAVSPAVCAGGLFVRGWRPGDALRPLGLGGRKKVQDVFVDRKVPRRERARVPLVVDRNDRIVWVAGHALEEAFKVTAPADAVVVLTITPFGGAR